MNKHTMKLLEVPFERIKNGTKTLEVRLYDDKRKVIDIGDTIEFFKLPDLQESINVRVTGLLRYSKFEDLIIDLPASRFGYSDNEKELLKSKIYEIYTREQEKEFGVLGIRLELI